MKKTNLLASILLCLSLWSITSCTKENSKPELTQELRSSSAIDDEPPGGPSCAATEAARSNNDLYLLGNIYDFREFLLNSNSSFSKEIIDVYYAETNKIAMIMVENPELCQEAYALLKNSEPFIFDFLNQRNEVIITESLVLQITTFLNRLDSALPKTATNLPNENKFISLFNKIKMNEIIGLKTAAAWEKLVNNYNK